MKFKVRLWKFRIRGKSANFSGIELHKQPHAKLAQSRQFGVWLAQKEIAVGGVMSELTEYQKHMLEVWGRHGYGEFIAKDPDIAIGTMGPNPYIIAVPLGQLLDGRDAVYSFYANDFLPNIPDDFEMEPLDRTIGENRIVDEFVVRFTHDRVMPWQIPGVAPTGRKVEMAMSVVVGFDGDLIAYEHLMWDHAGVLAQIGLIDHPAATGSLASPANLRAMVARRRR